MSTVDAALAAMDTAEQEVREIRAGNAAIFGARNVDLGRWARDRLRLIQRDRATLERHKQLNWLHIPVPNGFCEPCDVSPWPCPDARAVINHWTEDV